MKATTHTTRLCPLCNQTYQGAPALSRVDNRTQICPDCGTREALASLEISPEEQEHIIDIIHSSYNG